jgi:aspartate/methionine/tyrosine aminotransferase
VRRSIAALPASKIREVAHLGMGRDDVIPLWFGESDLPTPKFICDAAARALAAGDTF